MLTFPRLVHLGFLLLVWLAVGTYIAVGTYNHLTPQFKALQLKMKGTEQ